ncbi:selenocysteine-specific elongation factor [Patella vulgata]|uniref:selenocysteine-specific elongation factor n=1 Tax=Patella vulgata TaxID=6465 RepID=UPI00218079B4|nr:selenocysteine-specific elongation factor [Patella vulgata]
MDIEAKLFNFNVGVLGHVDSGKTSLSKALSTVASTASFDKNPQSKERGITLDLGFSSFAVDIPPHLKNELGSYEKVQYTLVDCPGHASLIRTIIGGAAIIDLMILVVDIVKGMQTQTAECLIIGEILCEKMIVVLNKTDLIEEEKRKPTIEKMKKRMLKTLERTRFADCPIVCTSAKPGGSDADSGSSAGVEDLITTIQNHTYLPNRNEIGPFIFSVDHCFSIRGQGTIMTGTCLQGSISINDTLEIPSLSVQKKIKSIQIFKKPAVKIVQGDRAGICVTQFDAKLMERGLVCTPGALPTIMAAIVSIEKIAFFKGNINTKAKFHITLGHETVMGKITVFGCEQDSGDNKFDFSKEYRYQDSYLTKDMCDGQDDRMMPIKQYALIELDKPVTCAINSLVIGSKLDTDVHANTCRLAFYGRLLEIFTSAKYAEESLPKLKIFKIKKREGGIDRVADEYSIIGKNLFKKTTNMDLFTNLKVVLSTGENGTIEGSFGTSDCDNSRID